MVIYNSQSGFTGFEGSSCDDLVDLGVTKATTALAPLLIDEPTLLAIEGAASAPAGLDAPIVPLGFDQESDEQPACGSNRVTAVRVSSVVRVATVGSLPSKQISSRIILSGLVESMIV